MFFFQPVYPPPPVLEKDTFPWWKKTVHFQAKCHQDRQREYIFIRRDGLVAKKKKLNCPNP